METTRCSVGDSVKLQGPSDSREWMKRRRGRSGRACHRQGGRSDGHRCGVELLRSSATKENGSVGFTKHWGTFLSV
jgi:hypothetical protein